MSLDPLVLAPCPNDCEFDVPEVSFSECSPQYRTGEIRYWYVAKRGFPMTNWADPAEWASRISETATADTSIRRLVGIGEKPAAEKNEIPTSDGRTYISPRSFTSSFIVDDNSEENFQFARYTQACNPSFLGWYETFDGYLYGDNAGIEVSINAEEIIPTDRKALRTLNFTFTWEASAEPNRMVSVIA